MQHRNDCNLRLRTGNIEGQIAAERICLRALPAAVLPDEDRKVPRRLARREVVQRVDRLPVVWNAHAPLLDNLLRDRRGEPCVPRIDRHVMADCLGKPRADRAKPGVGQSHRLRGQLRVGIIVAVDKEHRPPAVAPHLTRYRRHIARIDCRHGGVKVQVCKVRHVPLPVVAVLLRNVRVDRFVKRVAVLEGLYLQRFLVCHEAKLQLAHAIRNCRNIEQLVITDRLCLAGPAHGIQTRERIGNEIVIGKLSRIRAGNCAGKLRRIRDFYHAVAARHGAGAA